MSPTWACPAASDEATMIRQHRSMKVDLTADPTPAFWDDLRARTRPEQQLFASPRWWDAWATAYLGEAGPWRGPLRFVVARDDAGAAMGALPLATLRVARQSLAAVGGFYQPYRTLPLARAEVRDVGA